MDAYTLICLAVWVLMSPAISQEQLRPLPATDVMFPAVEVAGAKTAAGEDVYEFGLFHFVSMGHLYVVYITSDSSRIAMVSPVEKGGTSDNESSSPFLPQDEGSGMSIEQLAGPQHVYTTHHHHAYIAVGQDIIELLLNPDNPNFHRIHVGHTPLQVVAGDYGRETYLYVLYEENDRGYVAAYRKYSNKDWGKYGQNDLLVYSPQWFDLTQMSNVLFFMADDWHNSYTVMYVAVAVGYRVYFKEILDGFQFSVNVPTPCEHIESINFNENKQTLFAVCANTTFYFDYREYQLYESSLWNRTGHTYFSQDGKLAAIATNVSGDMTTLTVHGLHSTSVSDEEQVYTFQHFHHVGSRSMIINGEFVTVSKTQHYFCYIELGEFGIICLDIEQAITNVNTEGVIKDAMMRLPNTHSVSCSSYSDCPVMYTHHSLLVAEVQVCEQECSPKVMLFNMSRIENIMNITNTRLDMHVYKAHPTPILLSSPANHTDNESTSPPHPTTTSPLPTTTAPAKTTMNLPMNHNPLPTPVHSTEKPTFAPTGVTTSSAPGTSPGDDPHAESEDSNELLDSCQGDLAAVSTSYDQLLYITITLCVCFCVAMVITVLVLVVMICVNKRERLQSCEHCSTVKK